MLPTTKVGPHPLAPVFPPQNQYTSDFFLWLPSCGSNQAWARLTESRGHSPPSLSVSRVATA